MIDEGAVAIMLKALSSQKWDEIILLGDVVNLDQVSRYDKDPNLIAQLQEDLDLTTELLKIIGAAAGNAKKTVLFGNHEGRLRKHLWRKDPELAGLRTNTIETQLHLKELGYRLQPERESYSVTDNFIASHGAKDDGCKYSQFSAYSARNTLQKKGVSGISGHTHRLGLYYVTDFTGVKLWAECGCLIDFKKAGYVTNPNWQLGFGILDVLSQHVCVRLFPILHYRCVVEGHVFRA